MKTTVTKPVHLFFVKICLDLCVAAAVAGLWWLDPLKRWFGGKRWGIGNDKMRTGTPINASEMLVYCWIVIIITSLVSSRVWIRIDPCVSTRATRAKCGSCKGDPDWRVLMAILAVDVLTVASCALVLLAFRYVLVRKPFTDVGFTVMWTVALVAIVVAIRLSIEIGSMLFDGEKAMLAYLPEEVSVALKQCYRGNMPADLVQPSPCKSSSWTPGTKDAEVSCGEVVSPTLGAKGNNVPRTLGKLVVLNSLGINIFVSLIVAILIGMSLLIGWIKAKTAQQSSSSGPGGPGGPGGLSSEQRELTAEKTTENDAGAQKDGRGSEGDGRKGSEGDAVEGSEGDDGREGDAVEGSEGDGRKGSEGDTVEGLEGDDGREGDGTKGDGREGDARSDGDGREGDGTKGDGTKGDGREGDAMSEGDDGREGDAEKDGRERAVSADKEISKPGASEPSPRDDKGASEDARGERASAETRGERASAESGPSEAESSEADNPSTRNHWGTVKKKMKALGEPSPGTSEADPRPSEADPRPSEEGASAAPRSESEPSPGDRTSEAAPRPIPIKNWEKVKTNIKELSESGRSADVSEPNPVSEESAEPNKSKWNKLHSLSKKMGHTR